MGRVLCKISQSSIGKGEVMRLSVTAMPGRCVDVKAKQRWSLFCEGEAG